MTNPSAYKSMMAVHSAWGPSKTFRLIPMDINCPFQECIYDPMSKIFVIISTIKKQNYHMVPQVDDHGDDVPAKRKRPNGKTIKEERRLIDAYTEYYIIEKSDMYAFINQVCINNDFDFKLFIEAQESAVISE